MMKSKVILTLLLSGVSIFTFNQIAKSSSREACWEWLLRKQIPELVFNSVKLLNGHEFEVFEVDNNWIIRLPKNKETKKKMFREVALLKKLDGKVNLSIPKPEILGTKSPFMIYKKIPGEILSKEDYNSLSPSNQYIIAEQIAYFMLEFQQAANQPEIINSFTFPSEKKREMVSKHIPENLLHLFHDTTERIAALEKTEQYTLVHHDIHGGNLTFDKKTCKITGVFDFTNVCLGSVYREPRRLSEISVKLMEDVSNIYGEIAHLPKYSDNVKLYFQHRQFYLLEKWYSLNKPNHPEAVFAMKHLLSLSSQLSCNHPKGHGFIVSAD